jgi:hypothetical protein
MSAREVGCSGWNPMSAVLGRRAAVTAKFAETPKASLAIVHCLVCVCVSCPFNNYWDEHARLDTLSSPGRRGGGTSKGHSAADTQSQAVQVETSLTPRSFEPHLNRGYTGRKGVVSRLASGGVVWQGHRHVVSNVHRREKVDRRGARGSSRCLTLLWWLTRRAGRHIPPPEGGG